MQSINNDRMICLVAVRANVGQITYFSCPVHKQALRLNHFKPVCSGWAGKVRSQFMIQTHDEQFWKRVCQSLLALI